MLRSHEMIVNAFKKRSENQKVSLHPQNFTQQNIQSLLEQSSFNNRMCALPSATKRSLDSFRSTFSTPADFTLYSGCKLGAPQPHVLACYLIKHWKKNNFNFKKNAAYIKLLSVQNEQIIKITPLAFMAPKDEVIQINYPNKTH